MVDLIEVRSADSLRRISRELRRMNDREVKKRFSRELRAAARPLVPVVRASIMSIPSKTGDGTLRRQMSRAAKLTVRTVGKDAGVTIRVDGRKMPPGKGALPAYMEGTKPRWRHPVFGNRNVYVDQKAHPYFYRVVTPYGRRARRTVDKVLTGISRDIT